MSMVATPSDAPEVIIILDDEPDVAIPVDALDDSDVEFVCTITKGLTSLIKSDVEIVSQTNVRKDRSSLSNIGERPALITSSPDKPVDDVLLDDVLCVGERTVLDSQSFYSHFRFMCSLPKPCPKCYCYVCDLPVDRCAKWWEHARAKDTPKWRALRRKALQEREPEKEK